MAVLEQCARLDALRMEACDRVSEHCIVALAQLTPRIKTLALAGCTAGATTLSVIQVTSDQCLTARWG